VKAFYQNEEAITIRQGKEDLVTTVQKETQKQLELHLSNAPTRLKRKH